MTVTIANITEIAISVLLCVLVASVIIRSTWHEIELFELNLDYVKLVIPAMIAGIFTLDGINGLTTGNDLNTYPDLASSITVFQVVILIWQGYPFIKAHAEINNKTTNKENKKEG